ncbi:hypothetical protein F5884DRAFT_784863 [Xylogone sp. PMI_703]|nr:hypothetical protein F5884DRAFT_784863 [Xylogone sp. PMI_703]
MAFTTPGRVCIVIGAMALSCLVVLVLQAANAVTLPRLPYRIYRVDKCTDQQVNRATYLIDDTVFRDHKLLLDLSHDADEELKAWLLPAKTGVIWTAYNETFRLGQGISMFHAMHCLLMIRRALQDKGDGASSSAHTHAAEDGSFLFHTHAPHCFSYIAQHVMCLGDSTIEPPWVHKDDAGNILRFGIDGENVPHKCKDRTRMWEVARRAQTETFEDWGWREGDTTESVFGGKGRPAVAKQGHM